MSDATPNSSGKQGDIWQLLPSLSDDEYEALKADIAERGVMVPVEYDENGDVLDGHHRVRACRELGIKEWPTVTRGGMDDAGKRRYVRALNLKRRHLNREQTRELIADALRDEPGRSNRQHARDLGVDHKSVQSVRGQLEATGEIPQLDRREGADGKVRPAQSAEPAEPEPTLDDPEPEPDRPVSVFAPDQKSQQRASEAVRNLGNGHAGKTLDVKRAEKAARDHQARNNPLRPGDEWYTPKWLFDALGIVYSIDVCSPPDRTHVSVPAEQHYTIDDDGLAQPWHGTVWCNPPYSDPEPWARRIVDHGDGLLLVHMPMNAAWCVDVWHACAGIRLFQALEFVRPDGNRQRPGYWLQLAAFGDTAAEALQRLKPPADVAENPRRVPSPMWRAA